MSTTSAPDIDKSMADHLDAPMASEIVNTIQVDNINLADTKAVFDNPTEPVAAAQELSAEAEINVETAKQHDSASSSIAQVPLDPITTRPTSNRRSHAESSTSRHFGQPFYDPHGFYSEALEKNLGGPPVGKKTNVFGGRAYGDNLREQYDDSNYGRGRQSSRFAGHEHQRLQGSYGHSYGGEENYYQDDGGYSSNGFDGPVRGQNGYRSVHSRTFDHEIHERRFQPSRASDYGEGELVDSGSFPQAETTSPLLRDNGDDAVEPPLSVSGNGGLDTSSEPPQPDDEDEDDDDGLFVPPGKPIAARGSRGGNRDQRSTRGHGRSRRAAAPSLRNGKAPFSTNSWGMLEGEEPARPTKRRAIQGDEGSPEIGFARQQHPGAWPNDQHQNYQGPSMSSSRHPQFYNYSQSQEFDEEDEEESMVSNFGEPVGFPRRSRPAPRPSFNQPGPDRNPSRYSGVVNTYNVNQDPPMVAQSEVSDAYLKKRGLERGKKSKVCKRGYGANDPENIRIVNMHETDGMTMAEIAKVLNVDRVAMGRKPTLTKLSCSARYARTAPLLFAAQGEVFVPLSERRKPGWEKSAPKIVWTEELDNVLVGCVQAWEQRRWTDVADLFYQETGTRLDPEIVSIRYSML